VIDTNAERPGKKRVILKGRGYSTAEAARDKLRKALQRDDIDVPDEDLVARRWTDEPVICPWEAVAWIPDDSKP
jgi:hypothetical protein